MKFLEKIFKDANFNRYLVKLSEKYELFQTCTKGKPKWLDNLMPLLHSLVSFKSHLTFYISFQHDYYIHGVNELNTFRRLWNHGGSIRNDHMVTAWNS